MEHYGYFGGLSRLPIQPLNQEQRQKVIQLFEKFEQDMKVFDME
jgi:hypothetical protein